MARGPKRRERVKLTLLQASEEFGVSREQIRRGLSVNGVDAKEAYTIREIHLAIAGDVKVATARDKMASAIARERENRVADGELIPVSTHLEWQHKTLLPMRQRLIALPAEMAHRCNPSDPKFARDALTVWRDEALAIWRKEISGD